jgi:hypothetical protein
MIDVELLTLTLETVTALPSGVVAVTVVTGQVGPALAAVTKPVPVTVTSSDFPVYQRFGDMEVTVGVGQVVICTVACSLGVVPDGPFSKVHT